MIITYFNGLSELFIVLPFENTSCGLLYTIHLDWIPNRRDFFLLNFGGFFKYSSKYYLIFNYTILEY